MPWLVMELLRGEDLATYASHRGPLAAREVRDIFQQLCHAMGAAHSAGIIHRDLKPENVFLAEQRSASASRSVKVLDFGIAKLVAESGAQATSAMGSPLWMAPEQTESGMLTPAADVWALGLIAFHLLTGIHLWKVTDGELTLPRLMREILFEPIPKATARAAERGAAGLLPSGFDAWFERCVARDPSARFGDASQAFRAMDFALAPARAHEAAFASTSLARETPAALPVVEPPQALAPVASKRASRKPRVEVVRTKKCPSCGATNRGDAYKCANCRSLFPRRS